MTSRGSSLAQKVRDIHKTIATVVRQEKLEDINLIVNNLNELKKIFERHVTDKIFIENINERFKSEDYGILRSTFSADEVISIIEESIDSINSNNDLVNFCQN